MTAAASSHAGRNSTDELPLETGPDIVESITGKPKISLALLITSRYGTLVYKEKWVITEYYCYS